MQFVDKKCKMLSVPSFNFPFCRNPASLSIQGLATSEWRHAGSWNNVRSWPVMPTKFSGILVLIGNLPTWVMGHESWASILRVPVPRPTGRVVLKKKNLILSLIKYEDNQEEYKRRIVEVERFWREARLPWFGHGGRVDILDKIHAREVKWMVWQKTMIGTGGGTWSAVGTPKVSSWKKKSLKVLEQMGE